VLTAVATALVVRLRLDTVPLTRSANVVAYRGTWRGVEVAAMILSDVASLDRSALFFHRAGGRKPLNRPFKHGNTVVLGTSEDTRGRTVLVCCLHDLERMSAACALASSDVAAAAAVEERVVNGRRVVGEAIMAPAKSRRRDFA
jgi:hypothetical protein